MQVELKIAASCQRAAKKATKIRGTCQFSTQPSSGNQNNLSTKESIEDFLLKNFLI
jgi:hypothetical protein